jgi:hypothetical protein
MHVEGESPLLEDQGHRVFVAALLAMTEAATIPVRVEML